MPLKHSTETLLIVVLGILFLVTGAILDILPSIPEGTVLWGVAWAGSVAYPLLLYPVLKERRADASIVVDTGDRIILPSGSYICCFMVYVGMVCRACHYWFRSAYRFFVERASTTEYARHGSYITICILHSIGCRGGIYTGAFLCGWSILESALACQYP